LTTSIHHGCEYLWILDACRDGCIGETNVLLYCYCTCMRVEDGGRIVGLIAELEKSIVLGDLILYSMRGLMSVVLYKYVKLETSLG